MRENSVRKTDTDKVDTFVIFQTFLMQDSLKFITLKDLIIFMFTASALVQSQCFPQKRKRIFRPYGGQLKLKTELSCETLNFMAHVRVSSRQVEPFNLLSVIKHELKPLQEQAATLVKFHEKHLL